MPVLISWVLSALLILVSAYLLPGIAVSGFLSALAVSLVLGLLNAIVKPVLIFMTLPINILTLGLFTFVINALIIMAAAAIVPGFAVSGFWWAVIFSIVLSILMPIVHQANKVNK